MVEIIKTLIETDIQAIIKSPELCLNLIRTYSKLYNFGREVKTCESALKNYHEILKKTGLMNAELQKKIDERTLIPNWNGLMYNTMVCTHISSELIYDEQAICYLNDGVLKESHFIKLPIGYKTETIQEKPSKPKKK